MTEREYLPLTSPDIETVYQSENLVLLSGKANPALARDIAHILRKKLDEPISIFGDGETRVKIAQNLRRNHVVIIQPTSPPVNDHIMELIFMIDAARRASADEITAVIPYFGYSRQDRKEMSRVPISSSVVAGMIEWVGADSIFTLDIHSEQQEGFVKIPWHNLYASYCLLPVIKSENLKDLVVASPDKGGVGRATAFARRLNTDFAIVYKQRDIEVNNHSKALAMIGDVEGKTVLLVDDIIDTAGTITDGSKLLKENGARRVLAAATHGLFSGDALDNITKSPIEKVFITDTINLREEVRNHPKIEVVTVAPFLAEIIARIETGTPVSELIL